MGINYVYRSHVILLNYSDFKIITVIIYLIILILYCPTTHNLIYLKKSTMFKIKIFIVSKNVTDGKGNCENMVVKVLVLEN